MQQIWILWVIIQNFEHLNQNVIPSSNTLPECWFDPFTYVWEIFEFLAVDISRCLNIGSYKGLHNLPKTPPWSSVPSQALAPQSTPLPDLNLTHGSNNIWLNCTSDEPVILTTSQSRSFRIKTSLSRKHIFESQGICSLLMIYGSLKVYFIFGNASFFQILENQMLNYNIFN